MFPREPVTTHITKIQSPPDEHAVLVRKEELLEELRVEEKHGAETSLRLRTRYVTAENEEAGRAKAIQEEKAVLAEFEGRLAKLQESNVGVNVRQMVRNLSASAPADLLQGHESMLNSEVEAARGELTAMQGAKTVLVQETAGHNVERLRALGAELRAESEENESLIANRHVACSQLKAVEAMSASSATQVTMRQTALRSSLEQIEEYEQAMVDYRVQTENFESMMPDAMSGFHNARSAAQARPRVEAAIAKLNGEVATLSSQVNELERESAQSQVQTEEKAARFLEIDQANTRYILRRLAEQEAECRAMASELPQVCAKRESLEELASRIVVENAGMNNVLCDVQDQHVRDARANEARVNQFEVNLQAETARDDRFRKEEEFLEQRMIFAEEVLLQKRAEVRMRDTEFRRIREDVEAQRNSLRNPSGQCLDTPFEIDSNSAPRLFSRFGGTPAPRERSSEVSGPTEAVFPYFPTRVSHFSTVTMDNVGSPRAQAPRLQSPSFQLPELALPPLSGLAYSGMQFASQPQHLSQGQGSLGGPLSPDLSWSSSAVRSPGLRQHGSASSPLAHRAWDPSDRLRHSGANNGLPSTSPGGPQSHRPWSSAP